MKIVWVSPFGDGWSIAKKLRDAGNRIVYFCPEPGNKNALGYLPRVSEGQWYDFASKADLVVVDGNFPSRQTRRSWEPSDYSLKLQQLRHKGIPLIGPTPTTELLESDPRYLRKVLTRAGLKPHADESGISVTVSIDPEGRNYLIFRHRDLLGDGRGPELGNLGDIAIPIPAHIKLVRQVIEPIRGFLGRVGYSGYINVAVSAGADLSVQSVHCRFIYPAVFAQFADLLSPLLGENSRKPRIGLAVSLLRLDHQGPEEAQELIESPGFFPYQIHREAEDLGAIVNGEVLGAVVGLADTWGAVKNKVDNQLSRIARPGWGWRTNLGENVIGHLEALHKWGWLDGS